MDKLQHIDELLKSSASSFANSLEVGDNDWLAVERKLKQRKSRIYAVWFFLALIVASTTIVLINNNISTSENNIVETPITQENSLNQDDEISDVNAEKQINSAEQEIFLNDNVKSESDELPTTTNSNSIKPVQNIVITNPNLPPTPAQNISVGKDETKVLKANTPHNPISIPFKSKSTNIANYILDQETLTSELPPSIPTIALIENNSSIKKNNTIFNGYWEAGASFTPSISGKFISENTKLSGLINRAYYNNVANGENAAFSNSTGLNAQYHLPSGLFIASGFFVSQRAEALNYNYTITEYPRINNNEITGYNPLSPAAYINVEHSGSNSYHFVEIPLNIGYKQSISSNFELRGQIGMSYLNLFNLNGLKADYTSLELKNLNSYGFNQNNLAANAKMGLYLDKKNFVFGLEPVFNYNITSLSETNTAIKIKPYSYGFNISTNYKLKN